MSPIDNNVNLGPILPQPAYTPVGPTPAAPAQAAVAVLATDRNLGGIEQLAQQLTAGYKSLDAALESGDVAGASQQLATMKQLADDGATRTAGTAYAPTFLRLQAKLQLVGVQVELLNTRQAPPAAAGGAAQPSFDDAMAQIDGLQVPKAVPAEPATVTGPAEAAEEAAPAPETAPKQQMMVGLPGHGGRMIEVDAKPPAEHKGMFGFLGKIADWGGKALETVGRVVTFPLTLASKVLDPVRDIVGKGLSWVRHGIDDTLGQIPIIGSAVRFTTGLLNSVVGLVDGALQGITHPVELVKGLGSMLWTASGLLPGPRMLWDMAVNGKGPLESLKDSWGEGGAVLKGFFGNALEEVKKGNYAGALGQVVGDVGSFFVGAGEVGAAGKAAELSGVAAKASMASRAAKLVEAGGLGSKAAELAKAGELSAKVAKVGEVGGKYAKLMQLDHAVAAGRSVIKLGLNTSGKIFEFGLSKNFKIVNWAGQKVATRFSKVVNRFPKIQHAVDVGAEGMGRIRKSVMARLQRTQEPIVLEADAAKVENAEVKVGGAQRPGANPPPLPNQPPPLPPRHMPPPLPLQIKPGMKISMPSMSEAGVTREYTLMGVRDGKLVMMRNLDFKTRILPASEVLLHNPALVDAFMQKLIGEPIRVPSVTNPAELRVASIRGSANGQIWVERALDKTPRQVDLRTILTTNPQLADRFMHELDPTFGKASDLAAGETRLNINVQKLWEVTGDEGRIALNREHQILTARSRLAKMAPAESAQYMKLLNSASTRTEAVMITRSLAAGRSVAEINSYAYAMRAVAGGNVNQLHALGFTDGMVKHLQALTPEQRVLRVSTLEGLQQYFTDSCNPTSFQIVRGEMDPIYAFNGQRNPMSLIKEQERLMNAHGGVAIARAPKFVDKLKEFFFGKKTGKGTYPDAMAKELNSLSEGTRVTYTPHDLTHSTAIDAKGRWHSTPDSRKFAMRDIATSLKQGKPTEIFVQWLDGAGNAGNGAHAIGVVDSRVLANGERQFLLHDPEFLYQGQWQPYTAWVNESDIVAGHLGPKYSTPGELYSYLKTS